MMNTRKFPRTMQEAFGPYTSRDLCDSDSRAPARFALGIAYVIAFAVLALVLFGVM